MKTRAPAAGWHIVTSEFPPDRGGVSDYAGALASALAAAGDEVHVWSRRSGSRRKSQGFQLHELFNTFGPRELRRVGKALNREPAPRRMLVQWVPHGFGFRSANLFFCGWLWWRSRVVGDRVELMVHEPFVAFAGSARQWALALVHRVMTVMLMTAGDRIWISIPAWERLLRPYAIGRSIPFGWLPVPSAIEPRSSDSVDTLRLSLLGSSSALVGHFGTFGGLIRGLVVPSLTELLGRRSDVEVLLIGRGSEAARAEIAVRDPALATRVHATGELDSGGISRHLQACDLLIQPYPDGVSSRRTTMMAGLAHGAPVVTNRGRLMEAGVWENAVALADSAETAEVVRVTEELLADPARRKELSAAGRELYETRFAIAHTVRALRADPLDSGAGGTI